MMVLGIAGGSGSGKTTVVRKIFELFSQDEVALLSQDNYYVDNSHLSEKEKKEYNFDHPKAIEFPLIVDHIDKLKKGESIKQPTYSYITCSRGEGVEMTPKKLIVIEGILVLTDAALRNQCDVKVYVDAPADERLIRLIHRDTTERGKSAEEVLNRYLNTVKPMHDTFIEPSKKNADIIVPEGGNNQVAIDMLVALMQLKINNIPSESSLESNKI